jgi:hypothetical protein
MSRSTGVYPALPIFIFMVWCLDIGLLYIF